MPKTVPKNCSQNDDLAECRRPGSGGPRAKAKRRRSELEPNGGEGEDESSHSATTAKRPNRTTESTTNQRVNQRRQSGDSTGEHLSSTATTPPVSPARADFLIQALQRIQELQDEIDFLENDPYAEDTDSSGTDEEFHDPQGAVVVGHQAEALGFAVCVRETMAFLEREGVPADSPMMVNLRNRLVGRCEQNLFC
ncbi:hypothetical protein RP20_CCG024374 [Aedes albopictus]|nr:hypothetical protein RP20_CCG024374 [Aedes albopictus]